MQQAFDSEPFVRWRCDECGEIIAAPQEGWFEWRERDGALVDFRIVHHVAASPRGGTQGCYGQSVAGNMLLENTLGVDGLAWLLSLLGRAKVDQPQFAELVRRLHIPYYELARIHRVDSQSYETNGVREYTQAGILAKLRLVLAE
jgi:hypothetical protein